MTPAGRPSAAMEGTDAVADGEIHPFNKCRSDDAGEPQLTQLLPDVAEGAAKRTGESRDEPTSAQDFDDLSEMQLRAHHPRAIHPRPEMRGEQRVILAQPVREKDGDMPRREPVTESVHVRHGIRRFARGEQVAHHQLGGRDDGEPQPAHAGRGAQFGADFVQLHNLRPESRQQRLVEMVCMGTKVVEPAGNRLVVDTQDARNVRTCHSQRQQHKGGLHQQQRFLQTEARCIASAGEHVLTSLAAETSNIVLLPCPPVAHQRVYRGICAAKVLAVGIETGVSLRRAVFAPSSPRFSRDVGRRWWMQRRTVVLCRAQRTIVRRLRLGQLSFKPATTKLRDVLAQRFARGSRCQERLQRHTERAATPQQDLGRAGKVQANKDETVVVDGAGDPKAIQGRIEEIRKEIDLSTSDYDREKLQERLAKLSGGVAVIRVGAATETELKEKKHRVEDALSATRAAVEEGIVPGGGVALVNAASALDNLKMNNEDEQTGVLIVRRALEVPMKKIASNAGADGAVIINQVRQIQKEKNNNRIGYDVMTDKFVDMIDAGIPDPARVTRGAVENAASIASMILTTEVLITDMPEKDKKVSAPNMPEY
jgi:hypothetical protein